MLFVPSWDATKSGFPSPSRSPQEIFTVPIPELIAVWATKSVVPIILLFLNTSIFVAPSPALLIAISILPSRKHEGKTVATILAGSYYKDYANLSKEEYKIAKKKECQYHLQRVKELSGFDDIFYLYTRIG